MSAASIAFGIAKKVGKHPLAGRLFCVSERLLPLNRIARTSDLVAFHHPRPTSNPHVLIVPTKPVSSLTTDRIGDTRMYEIIWNMVELGCALSSRLPANAHWQLVINGGSRQEIGQLHGHLLHANASDTRGDVLTNPATDLAIWHQFYREIRDAAQIPGNGYSLHVIWTSQGGSRATLTQTLGA